jgi:DNA-binding CsgD family transcriptional regulator
MHIRLSKREEEILQLIIWEHTTEEIANALCLSMETIKSHRKNLLGKFRARNVAGLVRRAFRK